VLALTPFSPYFQYDKGPFGTHPYVVGDRARAVANDLFGSAASASTVPVGAKVRAVTSSTAQALLTVTTKGGDLLMSRPDETMVGTTESGDVLQDGTTTEVNNFQNLRSLNVVDPTTGQYRVSVRTASAQAMTLQDLNILFATDGGAQARLFVRFISTGGTDTVGFVLNSSAAPVLAILPRVLPPTALKATQANGGTLLSWTQPTDSRAIAYRVYARLVSENALSLLTSTTTTTYQADLPWSSSDEDLREFVVVSVTAEGKESFVSSSNSVRNRSFVSAHFSVGDAAAIGAGGTTLPFSVTFADQSQSTSPITAWAWDFDSDGVVDSTEQNPTFAFPAYGQYTVSLKVTSDDGEDTVVKTQLVTVSPCAPLKPSTTCSLDVNGDGLVDSRDGMLFFAVCSAFRVLL